MTYEADEHWAFPSVFKAFVEYLGCCLICGEVGCVDSPAQIDDSYVFAVEGVCFKKGGNEAADYVSLTFHVFKC